MIIHVHSSFCATSLIESVFGKAFAISQYVCNHFLETAQTPIDTIILPNAINLNYYKNNISFQERLNLRQKFNFSENDFVIIYCGRLVEVKGVKELIMAVNDIDREDIKLLIVGSANFKDASRTEYQKEIMTLANKSKICFTGYVDNNDLYRYHQMADIGVIPSLWEEGFGLVLVEMMASGLPTIVTKSGGLVEVGTTETSLFVEKGKEVVSNIKEAIIHLYEDKQLREKMKKASKERSLCFDGDKYLENFNSAIHSFV